MSGDRIFMHNLGMEHFAAMGTDEVGVADSPVATEGYTFANYGTVEQVSIRNRVMP